MGVAVGETTHWKHTYPNKEILSYFDLCTLPRLDIEVSVIPPDDEDDYEKLTEETRTLLTHFNPLAAAPVHRDESAYYNNSTAQSQFFKSVRKGFENVGMKIEMSEKVKTLGTCIYI